MDRKMYLLAVTLLLLTLFLSGCAPSNIEMVITADPLYFTQAGDQITFTYHISNGGDVSADYFYVSILANPNPTCPRNSLPRRTAVDCTYAYTVTEADVQNGRIHQTAYLTIEYDTCFRSEKASYRATIDVLFGAQPALTLGIDSNPGDFRAAGEEIAYTFTVRNSGNAEISDPITIEDSLMPASCPSGPLAPGAHVECTATYASTAADVDARVIRNTASAVAGEVRSEPVTHEVPFEALPALDLAVAGDRNYFANRGDVITFTYTLTNSGNVTLEGPFQIDASPLDTWDCLATSTLPPGETLVCSGSYQITASSYGSHLTHTVRAQGLVAGQPVLSQEVSLQISFSPPTPTPTAPSVEPPFNCSQILLPDTCNFYGDFCTWNAPAEQCENK